MRRPWFPIRWRGRLPAPPGRRDRMTAVARSVPGRALNLARIQEKLTLRAGAGLCSRLLLGGTIGHRDHFEGFVGQRLVSFLETALNYRGEQRPALVADIDRDFD